MNPCVFVLQDLSKSTNPSEPSKTYPRPIQEDKTSLLSFPEITPFLKTKYHLLWNLNIDYNICVPFPVYIVHYTADCEIIDIWFRICFLLFRLNNYPSNLWISKFIKIYLVKFRFKWFRNQEQERQLEQYGPEKSHV